MSLLDFARPVLFALFLWWFTTGLIIAVYGRSPMLTRFCFWGATGAMVGALLGLWFTRDMTSPTSVYLAFTSGLVVWGWQVAGYYLGYITGPTAERPLHSESSLSLRQRFNLAFRSGLYHELVAALFAIVLAAITWGQSNRWGLWIYLTMWLMHSSAKLNVFLGVRNFRIQFLPPHLHHLDRLLGRQNSNWLFPASVLVASTVALLLLYRAIVPVALPAQTVGFLLLATMIALGLLEHGMLVAPVPVALWGWGLRPLPPTPARERITSSVQDKLSVRAVSDQII
jgi:putative photosynthetic complex assembly protein 2